MTQHFTNTTQVNEHQKINLETHIKSVHLRSRPFKCWECPFAATQQGNLQTHVRIVHLEKGQFKEEDNNTQSNKEKRGDAISVVKTEPADEPVDKVEEKLFGTYQNNENEKLGRYKPSGRQKKQKLSSWGSRKIQREAMMRYDKKSGDYRCKIYPRPPFRTKKEIDMETHIKSVHLRIRENTIHLEKNQSRGNDFLKSNDDNGNDNFKRVDGKLIDSDPLAANQNEDGDKRITSAEATAAIEMLGKFLMQSDVNVDELLLHSQYKELVMSKIRNSTNST